MPKKRRKCFRPGCTVRFVPGRRDQKFHSEYCRNRYWRELHPRVMITHQTAAGTIAKSGRTAVVLHEKVGRKR